MSTAESSQALKNQFRHLQDQQQKKLQRRKQLKEEKDVVKSKPSTDTTVGSAFGISDDLDLKLADPPVKGSICSEELVDHLNDQIRELKDETGRLYKLLSERDLEVRQLRKKQQDAKTVSGSLPSGGVTNDTAATKIVELSKKVREITAELEGEKTKSKQLAKKCLNLENELQNQINTGQTGTGDKRPNHGHKSSLLEDLHDRQSMETEFKNIQEKLKQTELKVVEYRNQCQAVRQEVKMANKVIGQEVGEGATVQSLMNNPSNWRGRAQQIISLQKKVNELRSQIDNQSTAPYRTDMTLEDEFLGSASSRSSKTSVDERHKEQLRKMEKDRKEAQENMSSELKALEQDHEGLKQKMEASKARNKVLSSELKSSKHQTQILLEKGKHDDELIEALLKQQNQLKSAMEKTSKAQKDTQEKDDQNVKKLELKTQQENNVIEQLRVIVVEKEGKVKALEDEIRQMSIQKAQLNGTRAIFDSSPPATAQGTNQLSDRPPSSRPSTGGSTSRASTVLSEAMDSQRTPQSSARHPDGRSLSRQSAKETSDLTDRPGSRKGSARPASANRIDKKLLDDLQRQCQEYKSISQATTVERDRLQELVQVLQKRNEDIINRSTGAQADLVKQRRLNAELEKQLGKVKIDQSLSAKKVKSKTGASSLSLRESVAFDENPKTALEELETKLSIQKDENEALKAALQSTLQSKEEDLRLYSEMIDQTKNIFLQGLRQYRGQSTQS